MSLNQIWKKEHFVFFLAANSVLCERIRLHDVMTSVLLPLFVFSLSAKTIALPDIGQFLACNVKSPITVHSFSVKSDRGAKELTMYLAKHHDLPVNIVRHDHCQNQAELAR